MKTHEPMNGPYFIAFFLEFLFNEEKILLHTLMSDHSFVSRTSGQDMWASHQFSERSGWGSFPAESSSQICFIHRIFSLVLLICKVSTMTLKQLGEGSHMSLDLDSHQQTFFVETEYPSTLQAHVDCAWFCYMFFSSNFSSVPLANSQMGPCDMSVRDNFDELHQRLLRCYQSDILAMQEPTRNDEGRLHQ